MDRKHHPFTQPVTAEELFRREQQHMEFCKDAHCRHRHHRRRAVTFHFIFTLRGLQFTRKQFVVEESATTRKQVSEKHMSFTLQQGQSASVIGSHPVDASGSPSSATLSNLVYTSSDVTVFTVAADPNTPNGAIITSVGAGTASLSATATATETSGATETISASDTITVTAPPAPPPPPAASFGFVYGTPYATPAA